MSFLVDCDPFSATSSVWREENPFVREVSASGRAALGRAGRKMKALILAAGLGTRLRPLTLVRPKVLVPLMGMSVLEFWVARLAAAGYAEVAVNAYQGSEKLEAEVRNKIWPIPVRVRTEPFLLGTGGGIRNLLDFLGGEPFTVINGDIVCNAPLGVLHESHLLSGARVSLLLHDCEPFNNVAVHGGGAILGFGEEARAMARRSPEVKLMAFAGIHFIDPSVIAELPQGEYADIVPLYRKLILAGSPPCGVTLPDLFWREMGSLDAYRTLTRELSMLPEGFLSPLRTGTPVFVAAGARVAQNTRFTGVVVVGAGSRIASGCEIEDTVVWNGAAIESGSRLRGCIVTDGVSVDGLHENEIIMEENGNGKRRAASE